MLESIGMVRDFVLACLIHDLWLKPHAYSRGGSILGVDACSLQSHSSKHQQFTDVKHSEQASTASRVGLLMCRFKSVYATPEGRYRAAIWHEGRHVELGWYVDDLSAARAIDKAAICIQVSATSKQSHRTPIPIAMPHLQCEEGFRSTLHFAFSEIAMAHV